MAGAESSRSTVQNQQSSTPALPKTLEGLYQALAACTEDTDEQYRLALINAIVRHA